MRSNAQPADRASRRPEHETNRQATRWVVTGRDVGGRPARPRQPTTAKSPGTGPAYELIGKVAVMHEGRVKPLDTVAREEVKQIYGRETIKLHDPREEIEKILDPESHARQRPPPERPVENWGPVGAFIGWTVSPEFWDDQPFILVEYLPLRRRIVAETLATRLKAIADKSTTPDDEKARSAKARGRPGADRRRARPRSSAARKLPLEDKQDHRRARRQAERGAQVAHPARARRGQDHRQGSHASVPGLGQRAPGPATAIRRQSPVGRRGSPRSRSGRSRSPCGSRPTRRTAESGFRPRGLILIMPRPNNAKYLAETARTIKEAREKQEPARPAALQARRAQGDLHLLEQHPARRSPRPDRRREVRRTIHRLAPRQLGLGAAQGDSQVEARGAGRGRLPREPDPGVPGRLSRARTGRIELARPRVRGRGRASF